MATENLARPTVRLGHLRPTNSTPVPAIVRYAPLAPKMVRRAGWIPAADATARQDSNRQRRPVVPRRGAMPHSHTRAVHALAAVAPNLAASGGRSNHLPISTIEI